MSLPYVLMKRTRCYAIVITTMFLMFSDDSRELIPYLWSSWTDSKSSSENRNQEEVPTVQDWSLQLSSSIVVRLLVQLKLSVELKRLGKHARLKGPLIFTTCVDRTHNVESPSRYLSKEGWFC